MPSRPTVWKQSFIAEVWKQPGSELSTRQAGVLCYTMLWNKEEEGVQKWGWVVDRPHGTEVEAQEVTIASFSPKVVSVFR